MGNLLVASVTQQGASHAATRRPNEDSVCFELLPQGRGIVVAASDGAGSAHRAKEGSRLAATYAVKRTIQAIVEDEDDPAHAVKAGLLTAREAIKRRTEIIRESRVEDYHCTLILVAWVEDQVAAAQVGDGAAIVEHDRVCKMLTVPRQGEYVNETFFLTEPHFQQTMFTRETSGITALALFTDGLQKYAVDFRNRKANADFITRAITAMRNAETGEHPTDTTAPLPANVETSGFISDTDNGITAVSQVGNRLFNWVQEQVGHTADDMSLIVAAAPEHG